MSAAHLSRRCSRPGRRSAAGFALAAAIYLIVILAALAGFIAVLATHEQAGTIADIQGVRAYQAARTGVEWGLYNFKRASACSASTTIAPGGVLAAFTVTVSCTVSDMTTASTESTATVLIRRITANACNQPGAGGTCPNSAPGDGYIERQVSVVAGQ